jgi:enamine deaminase RidA (YjgF/YER057c/UK114 family)
MTIERKHTGARMSQIVIHGDTVYLAGQVAEKAPGAPAGAQTEAILKRIDELLAEAGSDKTKMLSATIWLADMRDFDCPRATPRGAPASRPSWPSPSTRSRSA